MTTPVKDPMFSAKTAGIGTLNTHGCVGSTTNKLTARGRSFPASEYIMAVRVFKECHVYFIIAQYHVLYSLIE